MITHDQWDTIKPGDQILFTSGKLRKVLKVGPFGRYLTFNKVNGSGTTCYNYADLYKKVVGIYRNKRKCKCACHKAGISLRHIRPCCSDTYIKWR